MPEELDNEEGVTAGVGQECLPELVAEKIGLRIEELIDELAALCVLGGIQVDPDVPPVALHLSEDLVQRMLRADTTEGHLARPVAADDQDWHTLDPPGEVEEERGRGGVRPLEIIKDDDQRLLLRQSAEYLDVLFEDLVLVERSSGPGGVLTGWVRRAVPVQTFFHFVDQPCLLHREGAQSGGQGGPGDEDTDKVRAQLEQHFGRGAKESAYPPRVFLTGGLLGRMVIGPSGEHVEHLSEREVGIAQTTLGVTLPPGDDKILEAPLSTAGELVHQGGLAGSGLARYEADLTLTGESLLQGALQPGDLVLPTDEGDVTSHGPPPPFGP